MDSSIWFTETREYAYKKYVSEKDDKVLELFVIVLWLKDWECPEATLMMEVYHFPLTTFLWLWEEVIFIWIIGLKTSQCKKMHFYIQETR